MESFKVVLKKDNWIETPDPEWKDQYPYFQEIKVDGMTDDNYFVDVDIESMGLSKEDSEKYFGPSWTWNKIITSKDTIGCLFYQKFPFDIYIILCKM